MIQLFPEDYIFEEPSHFTDPFRYIPHPAVSMAAKLVMEKIESDESLSRYFSEGKMLGVMVCKVRTSTPSEPSFCHLAAFSGNVGGRSSIEGFVPPIYDLTDPSGEFKSREAEITEINHEIERLSSSESLSRLERELKELEEANMTNLAAMKEMMAISRQKREKIRSECTDKDILASLIKESQHEKAELRRMKQAAEAAILQVRSQLKELTSAIDSLKRKRSSMSEKLQNWIFRQYIVNNAEEESSSILDVFHSVGLVPPGGTGECAAPKLLQYAYLSNLQPLAMGEFWYGKASETAVRVHGHFYPSCTSKCGPLLGYMLKGLNCPLHPEVYINYKTIYEDEYIIVVEKPSGIPSVPGLDGRISLQERLEQSHGQTIHAVHRLDMDTSGVMIYAKTPETAASLRKQFETRIIKKTYLAKLQKTEHLKPTDRGTINLPLSADYDERPRQKVDFMQGKSAITEYEIASENPDGTLNIIFHPVTGRTHQLRVHSAHELGLGRPIIGDLLYGGWSTDSASREETNVTEVQPQRLHLHALSITFRHPVTDQTLTFSSQELCYSTK